MKKFIPLYLLGVLLLPFTSHAATFFVNAATGNDANTCLSADMACLTIQAAVDLAAVTPEPDTINVAAGTYNSNPASDTIVDIGTGNNITLVGADTATTIIDGVDDKRGLRVAFGSTVSVSEMTIQNGNDSGSLAEGTGVRNEGTLTLDMVLVQNNNTDDGDGGGIFNGVDDPQPALLTIFNSTISGNSANGKGGGIANGGGDSDVAVGILIMVNSTVSGNTSGSNPAGDSAGGGIFNSTGSTTTLFNVTVAENTSLDTTGTLNGGGGVYNDGGTFNINNSLIANNSDNNVEDANDCLGTMASTEGFNLVEDTNGCTLGGIALGNIVGLDPTIGALASNGGSTPTHALLAFSAAIDAGDPDGCVNNTGADMTQDQRGSTRPVAGIQGGLSICDIGAFEAAAGTTPSGGGGGCAFAATATPGNITLISFLLSAISGLAFMRRRNR